MDVKEVRVDLALNTNSQNGCTNYMQNAEMEHIIKDKSYLDIGTHSMGKADTRPCAIIGPGRVLPPTNPDTHKSNTADPWECSDNYRYPYDSIKMGEYHPTRNISPRQTFQENMQRIMVPPTYSSMKNSDETIRNPKVNMPLESKYCDVPYPINILGSDHKSLRNGDSSVPSLNQSHPRSVLPHGWHTGVGMRPPKPFPVPEYYQYPEYSSCAGPRPTPVLQHQRIGHDDLQAVYPDRFYQEGNIRFKPYPTSKERFPQSRYEYVGANTFHPPTQFPIHKFDQKSMHNPHYSMYPQVPLQYIDRRYPDPIGYQRPPTQQHNTFRNQPIPSTYGPLPGNCYQNKSYPSLTENPKLSHINKIPYETNNKIFVELESSRSKVYPSPDNFHYNDRGQLIRGDILFSGHTSMNPMAQHQMYKKDNMISKNYDYPSQYRQREQHMNISNPHSRLPFQFSPNTISPCDSNASNETQMLGIPQEDCGYASQSSTTSVRSLDSISGPSDYYKRQMFTTMQNTVQQRNGNNRSIDNSSNKKNLDVRQFLQMWNEGDECESDNNKDTNPNSQSKTSNQEPLYVLGLVNVPNEELSKYDHLQKVSKLPENIKGYNNIEILNQYEQLVESTGMNNFHVKQTPFKEYKIPSKNFVARPEIVRPVSPLDVEAKISQSVIHKEVGCNFEIKPCSPKLLNVEVATPINDIHRERRIEKDLNPVGININRSSENKINTSINEAREVISCKMNHSTYTPDISVAIKPMYPLQDLGSNMSVCLTSLPQLDNPIELNLPEVNQQFINANKMDTSLTSHSDNLPSLESSLPNTCFTKSQSDYPQKSDISRQLSPLVSEKEITKLSKYRKTKKSENVTKDFESESNSLSYTQRTDSVIIKNPENVRIIQSESYNCVQNENNVTNNKQNHVIDPVIVTKYFDSDNFSESAIDFSLNKSETILQDEINTNEVHSKTQSLIVEEQDLCNNDDIKSLSNNDTTKDSIKVKHCDENNLDVSSLTKNQNHNQTLLTDNNSFENDRIVAGQGNLDFKINVEHQSTASTVFEKSLNTQPANGAFSIKSDKINKDELFKNIDIIKNESNSLNNAQSNNFKGFDKLPDLTNEPLVEQSNDTIFSTPNDISTKIKMDNLNVEILLDEKNNNKKVEDNKDTTSSNFHINLLHNNDFTSDFMLLDDEKIKCSKNESDDVSFNGSQISKSIDDDITIANPVQNTYSEVYDKTIISDISKYDLSIKDAIEELNDSCYEQDCAINTIQTEVYNPNMLYYKKRICKKELFSPWIQKLILYSEGLCKACKEIQDKDQTVNENVVISGYLDISIKNESFEEINTIEDKSDKFLYENFSKAEKVNLKKNDTVEVNFIEELKECQDSHSVQEENKETHFKDTYEKIETLSKSNFIGNDQINVETKEGEFSFCKPVAEEINFSEELEKEKDVLFSKNVTDNPESLEKVKDILLSINNDFENDELKEESVVNSSFATTTDLKVNNLDAPTESEHNRLKTDEGFENENKFLEDEATQIYPKDMEKVKVYESTDITEFETFSSTSLKQCNNSNHSNTIDQEDLKLNVFDDEKDIVLENNRIQCPDSSKEIEQTTERNGFMDVESMELATCSPKLFKKYVRENSDDTSTFGISNNDFESEKLIRNLNLDYSVSCVSHQENIKSGEKKSMLDNISSKFSRRTIKRSLSETALEAILEGRDDFFTSKRLKRQESSIDPELITTNLSNILPLNRRNSISEIYNDGSVFILIENDLLFSEEHEDQKTCLSNLEPVDNNFEYITENIGAVTINHVVTNDESLAIDEEWVEDVSCMDTLLSDDDIAENIEIGSPASPKDSTSCDCESTFNVSSIFCGESIKENPLAESPIEPHDMTRETLDFCESQNLNHEIKLHESIVDNINKNNAIYANDDRNDLGIFKTDNLMIPNSPNREMTINCNTSMKITENINCIEKLSSPTHSCGYSTEDEKVVKKHSQYSKYSSSPEVTSTTCDDKNSSILLKITNLNSPGLSQVDINSVSKNKISYKLTEKKNYKSYNPNFSSTGTLITKAAQKYIPPLKISMSDLKVKLPLPPNSLNKLKQMKKSKVEPKIDKKRDRSSAKRTPMETKKPKPKFEDVLMSIDEFQYKKHKEKKRVKNEIPKVVIKKNESGAHYTSSHSLETKEKRDPDLTGRKWQPWVFIEKNDLVDKMALKNKAKAIYCRRKNTYVLAEKFRKYKSVYNAKFVISQPKSDNLSKGNLKYTIRLKHH